MRMHRIPHSTNVVRVALAAAYKGILVEYVDHDPADRGAIRALSGQDLVPVVELGGEVLVDSSRIVERLERHMPDPPLFPAGAAERANVVLFVEWFDQIWKHPPNAIVAELERSSPDRDRIAALARQMAGRQPLFESLLTGRDHLLGDDFGAADVCAYPFLAYSAGRPPGDDEPFHLVLDEHLGLDGFPNLAAWLERVAARPLA
jgi:glutathione S-transferase